MTPTGCRPYGSCRKNCSTTGTTPFFDDAEIQTFVALRDGQPCGRVAALVNHAHNRQYDEQRGFFGFFESVEDEEVSGALFDAAREWFADRGIEAIRGPVNPSLNYECGLLVDGFDEPPWFMMTYNKPYYGHLIEQYGFRKAQNLYAFWGHVRILDENLAATRHAQPKYLGAV